MALFKQWEILNKCVAESDKQNSPLMLSGVIKGFVEKALAGGPDPGMIMVKVAGVP